ncbi:hypothetical protein CAGA_19840 [Caproiciproducens galactitolivorans]|jgi:hypothetical protein|uniref:Uncharacterized protein n=1 Tax=Caproiciproducens galactitolivorans TaxID=642589 RepID=A0A4Z0Y7T0_9FIRM|nr:hypothetical protein CAGA_19840 [Caproiciproducens galactitolivorans]
MRLAKLAPFFHGVSFVFTKAIHKKNLRFFIFSCCKIYEWLSLHNREEINVNNGIFSNLGNGY